MTHSNNNTVDSARKYIEKINKMKEYILEQTGISNKEVIRSFLEEQSDELISYMAENYSEAEQENGYPGHIDMMGE
jgi:hypothetical protein